MYLAVIFESLTVVEGGILEGNVIARPSQSMMINIWLSIHQWWKFWSQLWGGWKLQFSILILQGLVITEKMPILQFIGSSIWLRKRDGRHWDTRIAVIGASLEFLICGMRFCTLSFSSNITRKNNNSNRRGHR